MQTHVQLPLHLLVSTTTNLPASLADVASLEHGTASSSSPAHRVGRVVDAGGNQQPHQ
jgi:hypothetical protein